jgi:hypothetical protein
MNTDGDCKQSGTEARYWIVALCLPALITLPLILTAPIWWSQQTGVARVCGVAWALLFAVSFFATVVAIIIAIMASVRKDWALGTSVVMWALIAAAIGAVAYNFHIIAGA